MTRVQLAQHLENIGEHEAASCMWQMMSEVQQLTTALEESNAWLKEAQDRWEAALMNRCTCRPLKGGGGA